MLRLLLAFSILTFSGWCAAGEPLRAMQGLSGTAVHSFDSAINEHRYHIIVRPPQTRPADAVTYPTVYLLDGGALFPMLAAYTNYLRHEQAVPELLIVGVSYATDDWQQGNHRSVDYTAPSDERDFWGGAANFLEVLEKEVFPLVEANYPAEPNQRILFGQSLGGQFVLFAAQQRPDLFSGMIASNPALHRNLDFFLQPAELTATTARLYVASASNDFPQFREPALEWIEHWSSEEDPPWQLKTESIDGYSHFSVAPESFRRGVTWVLGGR